jgi:hypothetical protein
MQKKSIIRAAAMAVTLVGAPLAFSPQQGVRVNAACAQYEKKPVGGTGTCCFQMNAICITPNGNIGSAYYKTEGPCPT